MSRWFDDGRQTCNEISNWTVTAATAAETAITGHAATRTKTQNSIWIKQKNKNKCESEKIQEMQRALLCYYTKCVYIYMKEYQLWIFVYVASERCKYAHIHSLTRALENNNEPTERHTRTLISGAVRAAYILNMCVHYYAVYDMYILLPLLFIS